MIDSSNKQFLCSNRVLHQEQLAIFIVQRIEVFLRHNRQIPILSLHVESMPIAAEVLAMLLRIIKTCFAGRAFEFKRQIALLRALYGLFRTRRTRDCLRIPFTLRHLAHVFLRILYVVFSTSIVSTPITRIKYAVRSVGSGNRLSSQNVAGDVVLLAEFVDRLVICSIDEEFACFGGPGVNHLVRCSDLLHFEE